VEGDPYWAEVPKEEPRLARPEPQSKRALLVGDAEDLEAMTPMRARGHDIIRSGPQTVGRHRADTAYGNVCAPKHPDFDHLRLIKSDTDGF